MRILLACGAVFLSSTVPAAAFACSMAGCLGGGVEFRRDFTITVVHAGRPLPGVSIRISGTSETGIPKLFVYLTGEDGAAHFVDFPPGDYWIDAGLFGISAAYECFHVKSRPSSKARRKERYEWGDDAPAFRKAAGSFVDLQPGSGGTALQNLLHPVRVPVADARMELREPFTGTMFTTRTDADGHFVFDHVPKGMYVLHIDGPVERTGSSLDVEGILVEFSNKARLDTIALEHRDAGGGSCGGTGIDLVNSPAS